MALTKLEKLMFPGFLLAFEVVFLILFGLLVDYDRTGIPNPSMQAAQEGATADNTQTVYAFFQDVHVMIFVGFGFLMTFLRRYGHSSIAFNMLLAAFAIQWSTITIGVFTFIDQSQAEDDARAGGTTVDPEDECCTIRVGIASIVSSDFAAAAVLITMGAVLGRASPFQLVIIAFFELMFYSANEALNIHVLEASDIGGSMIIHTFGAYFGLACSFMLFNRKAIDHNRNSSVYHSDLFAMIGTLFLWLFWPSFNGALATGNAQTRAIINTYFSMTGSVIATFTASMFLSGNRKFNMTLVQNATLAGGVAVGSVANMVIQPWAAILIGFLSGCLSVIGYKYFSPTMDKWLYLQDTCGVHNLHGLPGVFSGIASAIAAGVAQFSGGSGSVTYGNSLFIVFPPRAPSNLSDLTPEQLALGIEPGEGRHAGVQAGYQLALLASTLGISIFGGLLTGLIVRWLPTFQPVSKDYLFDDSPYWKLPDDADVYLPEGDENIPVHTPTLRHRNVSIQQPFEIEEKAAEPSRYPTTQSDV